MPKTHEMVWKMKWKTHNFLNKKGNLHFINILNTVVKF